MTLSLSVLLTGLYVAEVSSVIYVISESDALSVAIIIHIFEAGAIEKIEVVHLKNEVDVLAKGKLF